MTLLRTIICITGVFFFIGLAESQAGDPLQCELEIEVNALRGGSPTVVVEGTKDITAKARILKGSAPSGTTIDTELRIEAVDGSEVIFSQSMFPIQLEVGKGGQGRKITTTIPKCDTGSIDFVATFSGIAGNGATCEGTRSINKTCK